MSTLVDDAPYPEGQPPDGAISHLFCKYGIPNDKRVRFAARIRKVDQVSEIHLHMGCQICHHR